MREIRTSDSEGGLAANSTGSSCPYQVVRHGEVDAIYIPWTARGARPGAVVFSTSNRYGSCSQSTFRSGPLTSFSGDLFDAEDLF